MQEGDGGGSLTVDGSPTNAFQVVIQITAQGGLNTAAFKASINGGHSFTDEITVPVTGSYALEGTGLTVQFTEAAEVDQKPSSRAALNGVHGGVGQRGQAQPASDLGGVHVAGDDDRRVGHHGRGPDLDAQPVAGGGRKAEQTVRNDRLNVSKHCFLASLSLGCAHGGPGKIGDRPEERLLGHSPAGPVEVVEIEKINGKENTDGK